MWCTHRTATANCIQQSSPSETGKLIIRHLWKFKYVIVRRLDSYPSQLRAVLTLYVKYQFLCFPPTSN